MKKKPSGHLGVQLGVRTPKEAYLSFALNKIVDASSEKSDGAYLFYSMFDLDIIGAMRLEDEEEGRESYRNNVRRCLSQA